MYYPDLSDYECEECGSTNFPDISRPYYEFSDADGNRGIWVRYITCVDCGFEYYIETGY